jgi:colicin import membrane protein
MNSMRRDEWELFLAQRENGTSWQWPLNLAVALHIALFGTAVVLQNMADRRPRFDLDNIVTVDLISMTESGPAAKAKELVPEQPIEPPAESTPEPEAPPVAKNIEVIKPHNAVKKAIAPPPVVEKIVESKPEPPVAQEKPVLQKTAEKVAVKAKEVPQPVAREKTVVQKPVEKLEVVKPKQAVKKVVAKPEAAPKPKEAVSLSPERHKTAPPAVKKVVEQAKKKEVAAESKKKEAQAKIVEAKKLAAEKARQAEQAKVAETKKKEAQAKIAEEKKLAAEQAKIVAAKKKEAQAKAAKLAEEKKLAAEKAEKAAAARKKLAEQKRREALAEAKQVEQEAAQAQQAAEKAREQLAQALREEAAVKSAVAAIHKSGIDNATGTGGNGRGAGSSPLALNRYAVLLNAKISDCWKLPEVMAANKGLKTIVALNVSKNGTINAIKIEKKSGDALFDQSVLKALRSAEPLPKFPTLIQEENLEFALNFTPNGLI